MVSLNEWFRKNAQFPLFGTLVAIGVAQFSYLAFWISKNTEMQRQTTEQVVEVASLAIIQRNRPLLEAILRLSVRELGATQIVLCEGAKEILGYPSIRYGCDLEPTWSSRVLERPARGISQYRMLFRLPRFGGGFASAVLLGFTTLFLLLSILALRLVQRRLEQDLLKPLLSHDSQEALPPIRELHQLRQRNEELVSLRSREAVTSAILERNAQLSHDIRSPLAALSVGLGDLTSVPEPRRAIVASALRRISDMARLLVTPAASVEERLTPAELSPEVFRIHLLASLIEKIASEKRLQFRSRFGVHIGYRMTPDDYGVFVRLQATEFGRVLSNLLNNSIEALSSTGVVEVSTVARGNRAHIYIRDTGAGIPPDILPQLTRRGATFGKRGGSGLGLYHANKVIEASDGVLSITSELGVGTSIGISLPLAPPPSWFVPSIAVSSTSDVCILDDDPSIHQVWESRFRSNPAMSPVELNHFFDSEAVPPPSSAAADRLYLIDYELSDGDTCNGRELIERLGIAKSAILVTSRFEDNDIVDACERSSIRMIPKSMAGFVPIVSA